MDDPCIFCEDIKNYPISYNVFVKNSKYISIVADVSALTVGHLLIITKRHAKSFAQTSDNEMSQALEVIASIRVFLESKGYDLIIAEHGSGSPEEFSPACIDHAHLHLVPVKNDAAAVFQSTVEHYDKIRSHLEIASILDLQRPYNGSSYLYLSFKDENYVWKAEMSFYHQFFRFALSASLENSIANPMWQMGIDKSKAIATAEFYRPLLGGFEHVRKLSKLVRDRIPIIAVANGQIPVVSKVSKLDRRSELLNKLQEEIEEMTASFSEEEFADIMEVLSALMIEGNIKFDNVLATMEKKRAERGGFEQGLKLDYVLDQG